MYNTASPIHRRLLRCLCLISVAIASTGCGGKRVQIATKTGVDAISAWREAVAAEIKASVTGEPTTAEEKRNKAMSYSEALVVSRYGSIRERLVSGRALSGVAFDALNLGLTGTVPIVNGERGKTILGALATGFLGLQNSIDKNVFQQQTTGALLSAMDTCVTRQRLVLAERRSLALARYDEYNAYADLVQLYGCTTTAGAVQELTETQAAESKSVRGVVAPVSIDDLAAFKAIQAAFIKSLDTDKKVAVSFLMLLKVAGISTASTREELIAAYSGLMGGAATNANFRQTIVRAAREAGLL